MAPTPPIFRNDCCVYSHFCIFFAGTLPASHTLFFRQPLAIPLLVQFAISTLGGLAQALRSSCSGDVFSQHSVRGRKEVLLELI